jgi:two-component system cell cycle response regulator
MVLTPVGSFLRRHFQLPADISFGKYGRVKPPKTKANKHIMDTSPLNSDFTSAFNLVSGLLSQSQSDRSNHDPERFEAGIAGFRSLDFPSLDDLKSAYLAHQGPAICFLNCDEVADVISWIRDSDDISVVGEPPELKNWRLERIAKSHDRRLDPLTKVFCREELIEALQSACLIASPFQPVSLILMDLDHLKSINDQAGARAGDQILKQMGTLVNSICRNSLVARTRGGEFGVMVQSNESIAKQIAAILRESVDNYPWIGFVGVTASFGVATACAKCEPSLILSQADEALFAAKAIGRNQVVCYSEIVDVSRVDSDQLEVITLENKARVMSERVTNFVTQQSKRIMMTLHKEANTDALTQLFNRRYLDKQLTEEFNQAIVKGKELCIALVDLDNFGNVNKVHGWPTGDKALCTVADLIMQSVRASDWVGRYGGEEICVVMPGTNLKRATIVCERIRRVIDAEPLTTTSDQPLHVTVSIGVVELNRQSDQSLTQMIERVSQLTLKAKSMGRNQVQN